MWFNAGGWKNHALEGGFVFFLFVCYRIAQSIDSRRFLSVLRVILDLSPIVLNGCLQAFGGELDRIILFGSSYYWIRNCIKNLVYFGLTGEV